MVCEWAVGWWGNGVRVGEERLGMMWRWSEIRVRNEHMRSDAGDGVG
jgi:hypothetical protein